MSVELSLLFGQEAGAPPDACNLIANCLSSISNIEAVSQGRSNFRLWQRGVIRDSLPEGQGVVILKGQEVYLASFTLNLDLLRLVARRLTEDLGNAGHPVFVREL